MDECIADCGLRIKRQLKPLEEAIVFSKPQSTNRNPKFNRA